jgi:murein DD-endopeptidase MepM/ murein hydrolase activator NlpD
MKDKKSTIKRWRFTYKFLIINEKTLEEVFNLKLSRLTAFTYFCATLVVVFALMSMFIIYTPVKYFLPGFSDISVRSNLTQEVIKIDSLANHIRLQDMQIQAMKNIISGSVPIDSIPEQQEITPEKWEELASKKSAFEQKFIEEYESGANYYPSIALEKTAAKPHLCSAPVLSGEILKSFNETQSGIEIVVKTGQRVSAIGAGTIVFSSFTLDNAYLVAIQHDNGYISVYKNLSQLLKNAGENVAAGEVIAVVGSTLIFEIWQNGKAINPEEIVIF